MEKSEQTGKSESLRVRLIDPDLESLELLRLGHHVVEIRAMSGHQDLSIDGHPTKYSVTAAGYTLHAASYAAPQPSLFDAVAEHLRIDGSEAVVLTRQFGDSAALDPDDSAGIFHDYPELVCGRRDFLDLSESERYVLAQALNELYASGVIDNLADEHEENWFRIHFGPAFLPWHRSFLLRFEQHLKSVNSRLSLPFWDWTREDDSRDLDAEPWRSFFGGRQNEGGMLDWHPEREKTGRHYPLPSIFNIVSQLGNDSYANFREIEGTSSLRPSSVGGW